jgi:hypothetical protein
MEQEYEKLGAFYLGREVDLASGVPSDDALLYESRDLTTHGVIIGMTGSGKTGLGLGLLEEAAMDRIPVIAIDPKGDLGNLLLTFPDLAPADFRPWINEDTARQKGLEPEAFAAAEATNWRDGLGKWNQDGERIRRLRDQVDLAIYTPGSAAGRPVSVLRSFDAPPRAVLDDPDALRDRIQSSVTGLLCLLGIDADPIRSREHILLSAILDDAWRKGRNLDLGALIQAIQQPPFTRLGVMEVESIYPAGDRFELAMQLNALLASPGFQGWMEGDPLDIAALLYTAEGKPRVSIFSIAHLGDAERMFFVTMLLSAILGWMRGQSGTTSLRAIVYMDEIFGFFPPVANPPSKGPMLTLLKQARAFGVGLVLASQNPVDLDYKGLGNTGTWFIGRLQTERDKERVLEALEGAMAGSSPIPRQELDRMLSGLGKRVFLLHNVHRGAPRLFETRWAMSYLAGPLTLAQIRRLEGAPSAAAAPVATAAPSAAPATATTATPALAAAPTAPPAAVPSTRPVLPPEITQLFVPPIARADGLTYRPALLASAEIRYSSSRHDIEETRPVQALVELADGPIPFSADRATPVELPVDLLDTEPVDGAAFAPLPPEASQARSYPRWGKELVRWIQGAFPITLFESKAHKAFSRPGEGEREFRMRLAVLGREARDAEAERLRRKYEPRFETLQERLRRAEQAVEKRAAQSQQVIRTTGISALGAILGGGSGRRGGGILGAFLGGGGRRAGTAIRSAGRAARSRQDVAHAEESADAAREQLAELEQEFESELQKLELASDAEESLEEEVIRPPLNAISLRVVALVWLPYGADAAGQPVPLWR